MGIRYLCGFNDLFHRCILHAKSDVVLYFLRYIENVKAGFLTRSTYINCKILWDKELHRTLFSNMCTKFQYSYWKLKAFLEDTVGKVKTKQ